MAQQTPAFATHFHQSAIAVIGIVLGIGLSAPQVQTMSFIIRQRLRSMYGTEAAHVNLGAGVRAAKATAFRD